MVKEMSNKPEFTVVIPARMASTRLPGKMLADLNGQPLICHTVARANESGAQKIVVATDHQDIADALVNSDCEVLLTDPSHPSGSDRLAEVADRLKFDQQHIVVNVQGDEPMIPPRLIDEVAAALASSSSANTVMATAAKVIDSDDALADPNTVKVVVNRHGSALYFSRSTIPYARGESDVLQYSLSLTSLAHNRRSSATLSDRPRQNLRPHATDFNHSASACGRILRRK